MKKSWLFFSALFLFLLLSQATSARAQENVVTVSPQLIQLDLSKQEAEAEFSYTNSTKQTIELSLSMEDVRELEDRGIPDLIDPSIVSNYKYGLSSWATFSTKSIIIKPGETKSVTVFIDKTRLSQGGHYASVLAEMSQISEGEAVRLRAILSSLLFVRTGPGFEKEQADVVDISPVHDFYAFPTSLVFLFQNTGNVDLIPYGVISLSDPIGRRVSKGIINENSLVTLPDSARKYASTLPRPDRFVPPGIYTATLEVNYGRKRTKISKSVRFFSLGSLSVKSIGVLGIVLLGAVIIARKFPRKKQQS